MQYNPSQRYNGKFRCNIAMFRYNLDQSPMACWGSKIALNMCTNLNHDMTIVFGKKRYATKVFLKTYKFWYNKIGSWRITIESSWWGTLLFKLKILEEWMTFSLLSWETNSNVTHYMINWKVLINYSSNGATRPFLAKN